MNKHPESSSLVVRMFFVTWSRPAEPPTLPFAYPVDLAGWTVTWMASPLSLLGVLTIYHTVQ